MHVAQVDLRLGETTLDRTWIGAGKQLWIGSNPGVQVAVAGIGAFPLVTGDASGFVVRAPVGTTLALDGRPIPDGELRLVRGCTVELSFGLARVSIELVPAPHVRVPRPQLDARPAIFATLSLLAHLGVWGTAMAAAPEAPRSAAHLVLARIGTRHSFATASRQAKPAPRDAVAPDLPQPQMLVALNPAPTVEPRTQSHSIATTDREESGAGPAQSGEDVAMAAPSAHAVSFDHEQLYLPDLAPGFGTARIYDPGPRAEFGTIAAGDYAIAQGTGHDDYDIGRDLKLSLGPGGSIADPLTAQAIRDALDRTNANAVHCDVIKGPLVRRVTIEGSGKPVQIEDLQGHIHDDCASRIIASVEFPPIGRETIAVVSIARAL
ncbi:MAG TPA: hypothetical protein VGG74_22055 [Kofleriaceae bacterium]|jgi:hypothetical protein